MLRKTIFCFAAMLFLMFAAISGSAQEAHLHAYYLSNLEPKVKCISHEDGTKEFRIYYTLHCKECTDEARYFIAEGRLKSSATSLPDQCLHDYQKTDMPCRFGYQVIDDVLHEVLCMYTAQCIQCADQLEYSIPNGIETHSYTLVHDGHLDEMDNMHAYIYTCSSCHHSSITLITCTCSN